MQGRTQRIETAPGNTSPSPATPARLGKYRLIEPIGEGGFGVVYKGFDPFIKRHVAIKTCTSPDPELRQRYYREAEIAGRLDHPNIVRIYDFGTEGETPYLVQEFLAGCDLAERTSGPEFLPYPERLLYLIHIARGLAYAHEQGVIHRDIKPDNIRILEDGTAKIMDFGVAMLLHAETRLTREGMAVGTAAYLAPEQVQGSSPDRRTDVFSYGTLAYELLTGFRPFERSSISATLYSIVHDDPKPISLPAHACPASLRQLIEGCLAKEPDDRLQDFGEILTRLEDIRDQVRSASDQRDYERELREFTGASPPEPRLERTARSPRPGFDPHLDHSWKPPRMAMQRRRRWKSGVWIVAISMLLVAGYLGLARQVHVPWPIIASAPTEPLTAAVANLEDEPGSMSPTEPTPASPAEAAPEVDPSTTPPTAAAETDSEPPTPPPVAPATLVIPTGWHPRITATIDGGEPLTLGRSRTLGLEPGRHTVDFRLSTADYRDSRTVRVELEPDSERTLPVPLGRPGLLSVQASLGSPQGVVRLDGQVLGLSPIRSHRLPPGQHHIQVFAVDHPTIALADHLIEIRSDREAVLTFDLTGQRELAVRERAIPTVESD